MKKTFLLLCIMFVLGNLVSSAQTKILKILSCQEIQQKLGKEKMYQLYWTEKVGAYLLAHPGIAELLKPRLDSVPYVKAHVKSTYYVFPGFVFIMYNNEVDIFDDDADVLIRTRFLSRKDWNTELNDSWPIRSVYFKLSEEKEFEPSQEELDSLCAKFAL